MTAREKLHRLVDELSETEVQVALSLFLQERQAVEQRAAAGDVQAAEDAWARANAREAIREERW